MYVNNDCHQLKLEKVISNICNYEYEYFLNKPNVVGVGCGYKVKGGFRTKKLSIHVFVSQKISCSHIRVQDRIPPTYKGIPTDVIETGIITTSSFTQRIRPAIGGYVIGTDDLLLGSSTLGCIVTDKKDYFILANNHTIATINEAPIGTKIIQPSFLYRGDLDSDVVANLSKYIPIKFKTFFRSPSNYVDCAIAKVSDKTLVSPEIAMIGIPKGTIEPKLDMSIKKSGFRTELTTGKITAMHSVLTVSYETIGKKAIFKEQVTTTCMADTGDSGALVLDDNDYAVGLLMSKSQNTTTINPISAVLKSLKVELVTG